MGCQYDQYVIIFELVTSIIKKSPSIVKTITYQRSLDRLAASDRGVSGRIIVAVKNGRQLGGNALVGHYRAEGGFNTGIAGEGEEKKSDGEACEQKVANGLPRYWHRNRGITC